ncbi:MAG: PAS domain S-box protein [Bacteroidales bacterium]|nr:PAS domain S-box protein [Bacteroidales bacterium]
MTGTPFRSYDGKDRFLQNSLFPIEIPNARYLGSIVRDITSLKKAEEELFKNTERFKKYVENSPVGIFITNEMAQYTYVNPSACRMLDYAMEEMLGMMITDVVPEEKAAPAV